MDTAELLQRTREKAYVTLIKLCEDTLVPPEVKLQAAVVLLQATERDRWPDSHDGELSDEDLAQTDEPLEVPA